MSLEEYTDSDKSDHELAKAILRRTLLSRCYGRENALSGRELAKYTPVSESTVRDLIGELRREENIPVYSLGMGYFVVDTPEELETCLDSIQEEIKTKQRTQRELTAAFNRL